jgi:hypothetical protein
MGHGWPKSCGRVESGARSTTVVSGARRHLPFVPCMDGARDAREKNLTFSRNVRVQPCIRPLNAAVVAAGPDVIR